MDILKAWLALMGSVIGLAVVCWICLRVEKGHPVENFDERQQSDRGRAYRFSYWTGVIYFMIIMTIMLFTEGSIPVDGYLLIAAGLMLQIIAFHVYSLMTGSALPLSKKPASIIIGNIVAGIIWLVTVFINTHSYGMALTGPGSIVWLQLLLSVNFLSVGVMHLISFLIREKE